MYRVLFLVLPHHSVGEKFLLAATGFELIEFIIKE
jgi:hypothetical protein